MKLLFFDIDGTIVSEGKKHYIPQSTKAAIAEARKNRNKVFVNSGRCFNFIRDEIRSIGFDGYVCGCGTEIIIGKKSIFHFELPREFCRKVADIALRKNIMITFEGSHLTAVSKDGMIRLLTSTYIDAIEYGKQIDISDEGFICDKFTIWESPQMDDELLGISKEYMRLIERGYDMIEAVPKGFSKATGMKAVADYYGLSMKDCIAFGDSMNDIEMIEQAGTSVSMGKCKPLDDKSTFVTIPLEQNGIYYAMKYLKLI